MVTTTVEEDLVVKIEKHFDNLFFIYKNGFCKRLMGYVSNEVLSKVRFGIELNEKELSDSISNFTRYKRESLIQELISYNELVKESMIE